MMLSLGRAGSSCSSVICVKCNTTRMNSSPRRLFRCVQCPDLCTQICHGVIVDGVDSHLVSDEEWGAAWKPNTIRQSSHIVRRVHDSSPDGAPMMDCRGEAPSTCFAAVTSTPCIQTKAGQTNPPVYFTADCVQQKDVLGSERLGKRLRKKWRRGDWQCRYLQSDAFIDLNHVICFHLHNAITQCLHSELQQTSPITLDSIRAITRFGKACCPCFREGAPKNCRCEQDLSKLDVTTLTPLSPEVISRQATINIGTG